MKDEIFKIRWYNWALKNKEDKDRITAVTQRPGITRLQKGMDSSVKWHRQAESTAKILGVGSWGDDGEWSMSN